MAAQEPLPGAEQLRAAALGVIAASRAMLDAVEAFVRDPNTATQVPSTLGDVARAVADSVGVRCSSARDTAGATPFERIEVS
jgi:hypothetical protein